VNFELSIEYKYDWSHSVTHTGQTLVVLHGYAMLVRYDTPTSDIQNPMKKFGTVLVAVAFPPDPLCAAIAMGLMQRWKNGLSTTTRFGARRPSFG
jgi:hypothetical protein